MCTDRWACLTSAILRVDRRQVHVSLFYCFPSTDETRQYFVFSSLLPPLSLSLLFHWHFNYVAVARAVVEKQPTKKTCWLDSSLQQRATMICEMKRDKIAAAQMKSAHVHTFTRLSDVVSHLLTHSLSYFSYQNVSSFYLCTFNCTYSCDFVLGERREETFHWRLSLWTSHFNWEMNVIINQEETRKLVIHWREMKLSFRRQNILPPGHVTFLFVASAESHFKDSCDKKAKLMSTRHISSVGRRERKWIARALSEVMKVTLLFARCRWNEANVHGNTKFMNIYREWEGERKHTYSWKAPERGQRERSEEERILWHLIIGERHVQDKMLNN